MPALREVRAADAGERLVDGSSTDEESLYHELEEITEPCTELDEDMFGMVLCSMIRDSHDIFAVKGHVGGKAGRLATTVLLLVFCIATQIFLLTKVKLFVSAKAVHDIRQTYDAFEMNMYHKLTVTENGFHRGVDGTFDPSLFSSMTSEEQAGACRIPLSQPDFFFVVLLIWTLTCCRELKECIFLFRSLILQTRTCASMSSSLKCCEDGATEADDFYVDSLTSYMKFAIASGVILPRALITGVLTWLGCRWLLATDCFEDLILNAVALEFILHLKDTLYHTLMTRKNKLDLTTTKVLPATRRKPAGMHIFVGALVWMLVAAVWVCLYMGVPHKMQGMQTVLPDYKWDIADVCTPWVKLRYCVTNCH
mmetsp:Transcript_80071/g.162039  ORF Transcript_80071/g.162039 Transcript_80071/m.162039 type:complete len:367 (-) Transcript_80071:95-1195(-)